MILKRFCGYTIDDMLRLKCMQSYDVSKGSPPFPHPNIPPLSMSVVVFPSVCVYIHISLHHHTTSYCSLQSKSSFRRGYFHHLLKDEGLFICMPVCIVKTLLIDQSKVSTWVICCVGGRIFQHLLCLAH